MSDNVSDSVALATINPLDYYKKIGAALFPVPAGSKAAAADFRNASADPAQWAAWQAQWPRCNFAVVAYRSRLIIVDVDDYDAAWAAWASLCASWGVSASDFEPHVQSARGGLHTYFAIPPDVDRRTLRQPDAMENVNVRAIGYTIAAGSHFDGKPYTLLCDAAPYLAPAALLEHCKRKPKPPAVAKPGSHNPEHVAAMLREATAAGAFESYQSWLHAGFALKAEYADDGFDLWAITFDETVDPDTAASKWQSFKGSGVTIKSLIDLARKAGWQGKVGADVQGAINKHLVTAPSIIPPCPVPPPPVATRTTMPPSYAMMTERPEWHHACVVDGNGKIIANLANALIALEGIDDFRHSIAFDEMLRATMYRGRRLTDNDVSEIQARLQWLGMPRVALATVAQAVDKYAADNPFHPVLQWLQALQWDGAARLDNWLIT